VEKIKITRFLKSVINAVDCCGRSNRFNIEVKLSLCTLKKKNFTVYIYIYLWISRNSIASTAMENQWKNVF